MNRVWTVTRRMTVVAVACTVVLAMYGCHKDEPEAPKGSGYYTGSDFKGAKSKQGGSPKGDANANPGADSGK